MTQPGSLDLSQIVRDDPHEQARLLSGRIQDLGGVVGNLAAATLLVQTDPGLGDDVEAAMSPARHHWQLIKAAAELVLSEPGNEMQSLATLAQLAREGAPPVQPRVGRLARAEIEEATPSATIVGPHTLLVGEEWIPLFTDQKAMLDVLRDTDGPINTPDLYERMGGSPGSILTRVRDRVREMAANVNGAIGSEVISEFTQAQSVYFELDGDTYIDEAPPSLESPREVFTQTAMYEGVVDTSLLDYPNMPEDNSIVIEILTDHQIKVDGRLVTFF